MYSLNQLLRECKGLDLIPLIELLKNKNRFSSNQPTQINIHEKENMRAIYDFTNAFLWILTTGSQTNASEYYLNLMKPIVEDLVSKEQMKPQILTLFEK